MPIAKEVILFDGVCNFCNSSVNFIMDRDPQQRFQFASLQSEAAHKLLGEHGEDPEQLDSVILIKQGQVFHKSTAALHIAKKLSGLWPVFFIFIIVPKFVRDFFYDLIAENRYKWFGKRETCRMPDPGQKDRFLE